MIIECCKCKKILGEKKPLEDRSRTHTYCDECYKDVLSDIEKLRNQKVLYEENKMNQIISFFEKSRDEGKIFDLGDGILGRVKELVPFNHLDGVKKIVFEPIKNESYYLERSNLGDDFVIEVEDFVSIYLN